MLDNSRESLSFSAAIEALPKIPLSSEQVQCLQTPEAFRTTLLESINNAHDRIYISALYIENDEAGKEVVRSLAAAKEMGVDVKILVDFHRNQRSRVGAPNDEFSAQVLKEVEGSGLEFLGVRVGETEKQGVLHTKGIIIDDTVFYTGASLNNVYLHYEDKLRLDRYWVFTSGDLADQMAVYLQKLMAIELVQSLSAEEKKKLNGTQALVPKFREKLASIQFVGDQTSFASESQMMVTPIAGLGEGNLIDQAIVEILSTAKEEDIFTVYTPYFNLTDDVRNALSKALKEGAMVNLVVGSRTASDFYRSPESIAETSVQLPIYNTSEGEGLKETFLNAFKGIKDRIKLRLFDALPYHYEQELRSYVKENINAIRQDLLRVYEWSNGEDSYHVKGIDKNKGELSLITGHNLNWRSTLSDLENALFLRNATSEIVADMVREHLYILRSTRRITGESAFESRFSYPVPVQIVLALKSLIAQCVKF